MTFLYPNPVLQTKHSFWRINLYVQCRCGYKSRCKPCVQRWSFLADWKRLMLEKGFSHNFDVLVTREVFLSLTVFVCEEKKMLYSSVTTGNFFSKRLSYLRPIFVNLSTEKHLHCQLIVAFEKKDLKIKVERRRNHWRQKRVVFQKSFWTSLRKTGNFEGIIFFLCLVNEISRKSFRIN